MDQAVIFCEMGCTPSQPAALAYILGIEDKKYPGVVGEIIGIGREMG